MYNRPGFKIERPKSPIKSSSSQMKYYVPYHKISLTKILTTLRNNSGYSISVCLERTAFAHWKHCVLPNQRLHLFRLQMDHLWQSTRGLPISITILGSKDYQANDFLTYPEIEDWGSRSAEKWCNIFESPSQCFLAFLQRWLFFGLLATVSGDQVPTSLFTRRGTLTTDLLPLLVRRWKLEVIQDPDRIYLFLIWVNRLLTNSFAKEWDHLAELRKQDGGREMTLLECLDECFMPNILGPEILMSIHLVSEFLMSIVGIRALQLHYPRKAKPVFFQGLSHRWTSLPSIRLRTDGWCISELSVLFGQFNTSSLLYLNSLRAPTFSKPMTKPGTRSSSCRSSCSEF